MKLKYTRSFSFLVNVDPCCTILALHSLIGSNVDAQLRQLVSEWTSLSGAQTVRVHSRPAPTTC